MLLMRVFSSPRVLPLALLCLLAAFAAPTACGDDDTVAIATDGGPDGTTGDRHVVVLFTSDEHSHMLSFSPELDDYPLATAPGQGALVGGVARRAAVIGKLRKEATDAKKDSILVSAGDNQMGCLPHLAFETESVDYKTMKALGYDATTFGNHEFDFGPKALAHAISAALAGGGLPPIVASNVHFSPDPGDDELAAHFSEASDDKPVHPYKVVTTAGGVKVGILGYVGINAAYVAPNKGPVRFSAPADPLTESNVAANLPALYSDLQPTVDKLRNVEKVELVVALSHSGVDDSTSEAGIAAGEDTQVCQNVSGIDLIVSGHAHNHDPKPLKMTNTATQKPCLVLNGGAFGKEIGRVDFTVPADASKGVSWDDTTQRLVPVDDTTVPDPAIGGKIDGFISRIESAGTGGSTLASLLSRAEGVTVADDPGKVGDLYFRELAKTDFDVKDTHALVWLSADAMLAQADALAPGLPATSVGLESAGVIRSTLAKGKSGAISAADAFNVVPLGQSPVDGSIGYPLIRGNITRIELRGVLELALARGGSTSDYDLGLAGIKVEFDRTRPSPSGSGELIDPTKGKVMRILLDSDHADGFEQYDTVLFDRNGTPGGDTKLISIVTSSYIGQFAAGAGVDLKNDGGQPLALADAIVKRADASQVKQVEAFMRFLTVIPGKKLPSTYDTAAPSYTKRWVCLNGC
jgi:5'-nucleotidase / UDP-sugar diphosphatase